MIKPIVKTESEKAVATVSMQRIASEIRGKILELSQKAQTPHIGSALSCVDILTAAYFNVLRLDPKHPASDRRDRFILSKGHAAQALYTTLARRGFFSMEFLDTFALSGSRLAEQPSPGCAPGVEVATGSLGHGLSWGIGMALAGRITKIPYRVFVLMSDGECNEGSVWEAAMFAPARKLENVTVIVDYNKWQATGRSNEVLALKPLRQKWEAFGWSAYEIDGHSMNEIVDALKNVPDGSGKPVAVIAHTIKGKGVSFMEDDNNWHYRLLTEEEVLKAKRELGLL